MSRETDRRSGRGRSSRTGLSAEEQTLWDHAASSMTPLARAKARVATSDTADFERAMQTPRTPAKTSASSLPGLPKAPSAAGPSTRPGATPELADFDRKSARKLRSGRMEIEARFDLHGMRQDEAHGALRGFLFGAYRREQRWVLVITGKGAPQRMGFARSDDDGYGQERRGVLRRLVPMWLAEPELRAIIVSFTSAGPQHGGDGALYIQLRNARRGQADED
jgi:DNA-nicking Smr family endonuclease